MSKFDEQYNSWVKNILENGYSNEGENVDQVWKDGTPAYNTAVWHDTFRIKPEDGFPLLTTKFVNPKSLSSEILWIAIKQSNVVQDLRDLGSQVWNEWENEQGTIGKAYGYQLANNTYRVETEKISLKAWNAIKPYGTTAELVKGKYVEVAYLDQISFVIQQLIDNPSSRRIITTLMNPRETHEMELPPCVWTTHWNMFNNKLHLAVTARSSDTFLGLPFNIAQYALLHRLIAHVTGYELGDFVFTGDNVHLYDRHIPIVKEQLKRKQLKAPEFWLDTTVKNINEFEYEKNFGWLNYDLETGHAGKLKAPISITKKEFERLKKQDQN